MGGRAGQGPLLQPRLGSLWVLPTWRLLGQFLPPSVHLSASPSRQPQVQALPSPSWTPLTTSCLEIPGETPWHPMPSQRCVASLQASPGGLVGRRGLSEAPDSVQKDGLCPQAAELPPCPPLTSPGTGPRAASSGSIAEPISWQRDTNGRRIKRPRPRLIWTARGAWTGWAWRGVWPLMEPY